MRGFDLAFVCLFIKELCKNCSNIFLEVIDQQTNIFCFLCNENEKSRKKKATTQTGVEKEKEKEKAKGKKPKKKHTWT